MTFCFIFLLFLLPSTLTMSYRHYSLDKLCPSAYLGSKAYLDTVVHHNEDIPTIDITDDPSMPSVLLEHIWDNSTYKHIHHCEFNVKGRTQWTYGSRGGIFVSIRELRFRQNIVGECIDYIIFELNNNEGPTSHKVCGTVFGNEAVGDIRNYFEIPNGFLKIIVHIGYHNVEPNEIAMKLTLTAFEDCNIDGEYKFRCSQNRCISRNLYDDSIINCFPPFCADEPRSYSRCGTKPTYFTPNTPHSHVLAVGSCLVLVIFGSAMAWYFLKLYVSCSLFFRNRQSAEPAEQIALNPIVEYETIYVPPATDNTLGVAQSSTGSPPSYESLFKKP